MLRLFITGGLYPPLRSSWQLRRLADDLPFRPFPEILFGILRLFHSITLSHILYLVFFAFPHNKVLSSFAACLSAPHRFFYKGMFENKKTAHSKEKVTKHYPLLRLDIQRTASNWILL